MSKIEQLIQQLCPEGVEYKRLGEVCEMRNGYTPSKSKPEYWEDGNIPWFRMEDIRTNGRILSDSIQHITAEGVKGKGLFPANSIILATTATIGEHALIIVDSLANQQFTNLSIRKSLEGEIDIKFFFYYMFIVDEWCKSNTNPGTFASVDTKKLANVLIPLPPLPVQQEIVRILDAFTQLEAELEAELEARKKQYAYYRDTLLSFEHDDPEVEYKKLGEVCEIITDNVAAGSFAEIARNVKYIREPDFALLVRTKDLKANFKNTDLIYTDEHAFEYLWRVNLNKESIILPNVGNCGEVYYTTAESFPHPHCVLASNAILVRSLSQNNRFLFHLFRSSCFQRPLMKIVSPVGQTKFNKGELKKILIPLPPLPVQQEIVRILDKFEALTTDLQSGLPAEIEARKKQYEYYRDRLLTFKVKN